MSVAKLIWFLVAQFAETAVVVDRTLVACFMFEKTCMLVFDQRMGREDSVRANMIGLERCL